MSTPKTSTRSAGSADLGEHRSAVAAVAELAAWARREGRLPLVIQVAGVRVEFGSSQAPTHIVPPKRDDATKLYQEFGGQPLAELLAEDDELEVVQ